MSDTKTKSGRLSVKRLDLDQYGPDEPTIAWSWATGRSTLSAGEMEAINELFDRADERNNDLTKFADNETIAEATIDEQNAIRELTWFDGEGGR